MGMTLAAQWHIEEPQLRITETDGRAALRAVTGQPVIPARARLRFGPGRTCEPLARLLDRAIVQAEAAGLQPDLLVVAGGSIEPAEDIVRVRRKAHGVADWIHSPTCRVQITLHPAAPPVPDVAAPGLAAPPAPAPSVPRVAAPPASAGKSSAATRAVWAALSEVIDPDLGVNVVDLGFVRAVTIEQRTAVLTMTLTSAACPLTGVLENQIRTELAPLDGIEGFRVDWQWLPAWRPADMTDSGREQLRAIGFTL
jgi:metal-sulfur cluster biosynthetic enzyme/ribosomal protein L22